MSDYLAAAHDEWGSLAAAHNTTIIDADAETITVAAYDNGGVASIDHKTLRSSDTPGLYFGAVGPLKDIGSAPRRSVDLPFA